MRPDFLDAAALALPVDRRGGKRYDKNMEFSLTEPEKQALLADARESIAARLQRREPRYLRGAEMEAETRAGKTALAVPCGAFVTLRENGELRGCIGRMNAADSLEKTVRIMALEAAFGDPRFPPLEPGELERCEIEISALSPLEPCENWREIEIGVHGVLLAQRGRSGVFLPQVPVEQGWGRDEYLEHLCVKAGLPPRSWEAPGARLFTFTALVFAEQDTGRN